jgi:hypothetical protein
VVTAGVEIDFPHRATVVVGAADAPPPARPVAQSALAFPGDGSVVSAGSAELYAACASVRAATGSAQLAVSVAARRRRDGCLGERHGRRRRCAERSRRGPPRWRPTLDALTRGTRSTRRLGLPRRATAGGHAGTG